MDFSPCFSPPSLLYSQGNGEDNEEKNLEWLSAVTHVPVTAQPAAVTLTFFPCGRSGRHLQVPAKMASSRLALCPPSFLTSLYFFFLLWVNIFLILDIVFVLLYIRFDERRFKEIELYCFIGLSTRCLTLSNNLIR